jgi:hypothetical protein
MDGLEAVHQKLVRAANELIALEWQRLEMPVPSLATAIEQGNVQAVEAWRKLSESRRRLRGLDARARADISSGGRSLAADLRELMGVIMKAPADEPAAAAKVKTALQPSPRDPTSRVPPPEGSRQAGAEGPGPAGELALRGHGRFVVRDAVPVRWVRVGLQPDPAELLQRPIP